MFERIVGNEEQAIKERIKILSYIKECYVISENFKIDGKKLDIEAAFQEAISPWSNTGTLIVFGDAEVVYREAEG